MQLLIGGIGRNVTVEQDLNRIKSVYDQVAQEYAETFAGEHAKKPKDQEMLLRFARAVGDGGPVWDLGCGPGHTAAHLKGLGVEISGLDLSERNLEQARTLYPGIHFRRGNMLDLGFDDDSVAGVVAFYAIVHFSEGQAERFFREVFRVLRPGGILLHTFHIGEGPNHVDEFLGKRVDIDFMFFTTGFIEGCLQRCGFQSIDVVEREPYPDVEFQSRRAYVFARKRGTVTY